jgi:D-sedoheptulose 7-phosphate isomerase
MDYKLDIKNYIACEIETLQKLDADAINDALNLLDETRLNKKRIYVFGNGGSAATASHMQNDFNKGVSEYIDIKFRFTCLNDNVATIMAIANDIGYDEVFRFQLEGQLEPGDVVMAISGSGNSKNVINAVEYAKSKGNKIIGITGYNGGKLKELADVSLHAPIMSMQVTEDIHMIFDHLMMSMFYKQLCGKEHLKK